jgi:RNA polymerase-binding transcription factor DksA
MPADRKCSLCDQPIPAARLEVLPSATMCLACSQKNPRKLDLSKIEIAQASPINRNGFAPSE